MFAKSGAIANPSLTLKRRLAASPEKVYAAWTEPAQLVHWFGPAGAEMLGAETDVRVGGSFRISFNTPNGEYNEVSGVYREVKPNEKLVFSWAWYTTPERESQVTVALKRDGGATMLTLTHELLFDEAARDGHRRGWTGAIDKLEKFFMGQRTSADIPARILDFYRKPVGMSAAGEHGRLFDRLPGDAGALAHIVPGLILHQHLAGLYGETPSPERISESQIRGVDGMLTHLLAHDGRPLFVPRTADRKLVGVCRHFTLLFVSMLRAKGVPARARCGFATYFEPGRFIDHWVGEVWNARDKRWILIDTQLDETLRTAFEIDFDPLDVPRDRFIVAGDAWAMCREGRADPDAFGIMDMQGYWFIAGNVMRDLAALNNVEMLPWDVWGAMPAPGATMQENALAAFDKLAASGRDPDAAFDTLRKLYADGASTVPPLVFNAVLGREEEVSF